jgi:hypothetical protein
MSTELLHNKPADSVRDEVDVLLWRLEEFQALGFTELEAVALSDSDADLGQARRLRKTRCPRDLALRILL